MCVPTTITSSAPIKMFVLHQLFYTLHYCYPASCTKLQYCAPNTTITVCPSPLLLCAVHHCYCAPCTTNTVRRAPLILCVEYHYNYASCTTNTVRPTPLLLPVWHHYYCAPCITLTVLSTPLFLYRTSCNAITLRHATQLPLILFVLTPNIHTWSSVTRNQE
jgi:hypothetical protein